jgi:acyl carrier protein
MQDPKQKIRRFLGQFFVNAHFGDEENILETRHVNSLFLMQLVQFVEREFVLQIEDEDLIIINFNSINAIEGLVRRKKMMDVSA